MKGSVQSIDKLVSSYGGELTQPEWLPFNFSFLLQQSPFQSGQRVNLTAFVVTVGGTLCSPSG